jgi:hypothetical protein
MSYPPPQEIPTKEEENESTSLQQTESSKLETEIPASQQENGQQFPLPPPVHPAFYDPQYNGMAGYGAPPPQYYGQMMMDPNQHQQQQQQQQYYDPNHQQQHQYYDPNQQQQPYYYYQAQNPQYDSFGQPIQEPELDTKVDDTVYVFSKPNEEQVQNLAKRLRSKYRIYLPYDWLGQADYDWYESWFMNLGNFVGFRIGLALYALWSLIKFHDRFFNETWDCVMDRLVDTTTLIRFPFVWLSLLSVFIGVGGMTIMSFFKLIVSEATFKKLSSFRASRSSLGQWRDWAVFGINYHYDAAPVMACMPLVLTVLPAGLFETKLALPIWPALTLPLLVLMDTWITKRCRFDGTYIRRYMIITISVLAIIGTLWTCFYSKVIREILAIYTAKALFIEIIPTGLLALAFAAIATLGTDSLYSFSVFKAHYLLANHFDSISARNIDDIVAQNAKHYKIKNEAKLVRQAQEEAAIQALYAEQMAAYQAAYEEQIAAASQPQE